TVSSCAGRQDLALPLACSTRDRPNCVYLSNLCPSVSKTVWLRLCRAVFMCVYFHPRPAPRGHPFGGYRRILRPHDPPGCAGAYAGPGKTMQAVSIPDASLDDALSRIQAGDIDAALAILRDLVQRNPSEGHAHALIGVCLAQQGDLDGAVKSLET